MTAGDVAPPLVAVLDRYPCLGEYNDHSLWAKKWGVTVDESYQPVRTAFGEMIGDARFDLCELSFAAYLQARSLGRPITLLPVTLACRFQHADLVAPEGAIDRGQGVEWLSGRRVGLMYYGQTTAVWLRRFLEKQHRFDHRRVTWVEVEASPAPDLGPPANVEVAVGGDLSTMLDAGEIDAMIGRYTGRHTLAPVLADAAADAVDWYRTTGIRTVNHGIVVREGLLARHEGQLFEIYRELRDVIARQPTSATPPHIDMYPRGYSELRPILMELADAAADQGVIHRPLTEDELAHPAIRGWD